nr:hypothetical protein [Tanacetum cinerariifolium]
MSSPPPPLSTNQEGQSKGSATPSSSKVAASAEYQAWMMTDIRLRSSLSLTPTDQQMDDDMALNVQAPSSDDEDIGNAHIPKASALVSTYLPPSEDSLLAQTGDIAMFMDWFCKRRGITKLKPQDLEGLAFKLVKVFHPNVIHLQLQMEECHKLLTDSVDDSILRHNVSKPLPLGGPPCQVTIQSDFFFNKDLEYLRYDSKGSRPALSISKMKAAYYPDVGLEQMVPDQMWIKEECKLTSKGDRRVVRTHIRILSVVRIEVFSMYEYDYMKKIVPCRADLNEHDRYVVQMIMRFNEIHKFSDGMLQQIDKALDYRVKEFKINRMNPGLNIRFWTRKDVDRSSVYTDQRGTVVLATLFNKSKQRHFCSFITNVYLQHYNYNHNKWSTSIKSGRTVTLTAKDMQKKKNDVKTRTTLLLFLPDEHQLRFKKYKTARELWAAILKTFGGNEATKKTKKNLLKQQYGNFRAEGSETLEQMLSRLQVIVGQLQFMDVEVEQDDLNQKFLTSLAPEWLMHTIVWRNKSDLDTMSLDDLYNHLKVYDSKVQKKTEPNSHNMAFISSAKHISGNEDGNTACVPIASTNVPTASASVATISQDTTCAYIASQF